MKSIIALLFLIILSGTVNFTKAQKFLIKGTKGRWIL